MSERAQEYTPPQKAYQKAAFYSTRPTGFTLFWRTFLPWQIWRFIRINLKMFTIIHRSHQTH